MIKNNLIYTTQISTSFVNYAIKFAFMVYLGAIGIEKGISLKLLGIFAASSYLLPLVLQKVFSQIENAKIFLFFNIIALAAGLYNLFYVMNLEIGLSLISVGLASINFSLPLLLDKNNTEDKHIRFIDLYVCFNIASFLAPFLVGVFQVSENWRLLGWILVVASVLPLLLFKGLFSKKSNIMGIKIAIFYAGLIIAMYYLYLSTILMEGVILISILCYGGIIFIKNKDSTMSLRGENTKKIFTILLAQLVFCCLFFQIFSSVSLLLSQYMNIKIYDFQVPSSWFLSINPLIIMIIYPFFRKYAMRLGSQNEKNISRGMLLLTLSFVVISLATLVSYTLPLFLFLFICFISILSFGELLLLPLGLSSIMVYSEKHNKGFYSASWYFAAGIGSYMSLKINSLIQYMVENKVIESAQGLTFLIMATIGSLAYFFISKVFKVEFK